MSQRETLAALTTVALLAVGCVAEPASSDTSASLTVYDAEGAAEIENAVDALALAGLEPTRHLVIDGRGNLLAEGAEAPSSFVTLESPRGFAVDLRGANAHYLASAISVPEATFTGFAQTPAAAILLELGLRAEAGDRAEAVVAGALTQGAVIDGPAGERLGLDRSALGSPELLRGDVNGDGNRDISDAITILGHASQGTPLDCPSLGDVDGDLDVDADDADALLGWLFLGTTAPAPLPASAPGGVCNLEGHLRHINVSFKWLLADARALGMFATEADIEAGVAEVNEVLSDNDADFRLLLDEVVYLMEPRWAQPLDCARPSPRDDIGDLELAAEADPQRFRWRTDAVNFYVTQRSGSCLGVCSFPDAQHDIIYLESNGAVALRPFLILHELGHYVGLPHNFQWARHPDTGESSAPCDHLDFSSAEDARCSGAAGLRDASFGPPLLHVASHNQTYNIECDVDVCAEPLNVMSYNSHQIGQERIHLAPSQIARINALLDTHRANVALQ